MKRCKMTLPVNYGGQGLTQGRETRPLVSVRYMRHQAGPPALAAAEYKMNICD